MPDPAPLPHDKKLQVLALLRAIEARVTHVNAPSIQSSTSTPKYTGTYFVISPRT